jgi:hypothetical protein
MNLNTGYTREIASSTQTRLLPLGFINEDLIYGIANSDDISTDLSGSVIFPMYGIYIQDEQGNTLKSYSQDGIYVTDVSVEDNLISLSRVVRDETGSYSTTTDDQIVNNYVEEDGYNSSEVVVTENFEKIVQLVLRKTMDSKLKVTNPLEVMFEGSRDLAIDIENPIVRYYVYGKYGIDATFTHEAAAVNLAYSINGTVVNQNGEYIWKKTTRSTRNQIMAITGTMASEDNSQLSVCIETILGFAGSVRKAQPLLDSGMTVKQILEENISDAVVLDLRGVSLDAVLYYVNQDIPVLATLSDGSAMLVVGFNDLNVVVMDPQSGTVYKLGMNDAASFFGESGNMFVTYVK